MRIATLTMCLACLFAVPVSRAAEGLKMETDPAANTLMVQGAPGMIHFHSSSEHVRYSWLVGAEWMHKSRWLGGYSYFNNSFGQKSHYLYGGYWWPIERISPNVYFKFTAGVLHGYKDKYEDKVPFNHNGTSPGVVMGLGYKTGRFNAQANLLGGAGWVESSDDRALRCFRLPPGEGARVRARMYAQAARCPARSQKPITGSIMHKHLPIALSLLVITGVAAAQGYPVRPIRLIVPFPPGGGNDVMARIIGQKLADAFGQQVVIDNRGGASGNIGTEIAARAAPDGHTLFLGGVGSHGTNPGLQSRLPYDPVRDFAPVSQIASASLVVVSNVALPTKTIGDLIRLAQQRPGQINYASSGTGSIAHLSVELLSTMAKIRLQHVPYKGTGPALTDLLGGQVQLLFNSALSMLPQIRGNRVRALAVTSATRITPLPDVHTIAESGVPGYDVTSWYGLLAPARTPRHIIDKLNAEIAKTLKTSELRDRLLSEGAIPVGNTPEQFAAFIQSELSRWTKVIKDAGIKME